MLSDGVSFFFMIYAKVKENDGDEIAAHFKMSAGTCGSIKRGSWEKHSRRELSRSFIYLTLCSTHDLTPIRSWS